MSQSRIKKSPEMQRKMDESAVADRLKLAADTIRAANKIPDVAICDAIGDSQWFREYMNICLQSPIANAFLGCIIFGWQLHEEYQQIKDATGIIYRA
jgi:hypothetical protein